jgi:hypothetical protein
MQRWGRPWHYRRQRLSTLAAACAYNELEVLSVNGSARKQSSGRNRLKKRQVQKQRKRQPNETRCLRSSARRCG